MTSAPACSWAREVKASSISLLVVTLRPAVFDRHILTLDIAAVAQSLAKGGHNRCIRAGSGAAAEVADHRHPLLLRARRRRPCERGAEADQKFAARAHSMISSARTRIGGGISIPRAWAAFWLITSSKRVGCCAGMLAGWAPFSTLSVKAASMM